MFVFETIVAIFSCSGTLNVDHERTGVVGCVRCYDQGIIADIFSISSTAGPVALLHGGLSAALSRRADWRLTHIPTKCLISPVENATVPLMYLTVLNYFVTADLELGSTFKALPCLIPIKM